MIKLIPCTKITKRELMTALMEGRRFCVVRNENDNAHDMIEWDENYGNNPVRNGAKNWDWRGFCHLHEITESHWYDNIPEEGVLCWVDNHENNTKHKAYIIVEHVPLSDSPFYAVVGMGTFVYAAPVNSTDLYQEPV